MKKSKGSEQTGTPQQLFELVALSTATYYNLITLLSFFLKIMERLMKSEIWTIVQSLPSHHAYGELNLRTQLSTLQSAILSRAFKRNSH